jgi:hypothetical protein
VTAVLIDHRPKEAIAMNRTTLTARYLDEIKRRGIPASELTRSKRLRDEMLLAFYQDRYLSRPVFLGHQEHVQLGTDLMNLRAALISLPDRLFGGDLTAFARAVGMTDVQISAILRSRNPSATMLARADMYVDESGFRMMEFNMGSAIGGVDNPEIMRGLLDHPVLADFAAEHRLEYIDTMREQVKTIKAESGFAPDSRPVMVMTDWPSSYETLESYIHLYTSRLSTLGLDACGGHIGQLEVHDGRVWLGERPVDIIYRLFMIEDLLEYPDAPALMDPILDAAARGEVKIFTPMDDSVFASKGALAMLSDEGNRHLLDPEHLAGLDRILPWTRMARSGPVTVPGGERRDLAEYAVAQQTELILKPVLMHGGLGVLPGWTASPQQWRERLADTMDGPFVLQRRVRPLSEPFPGDDGLQPWALSVSVFHGTGGFGGLWVRGTTELDGGVMNISRNAYATCCFHPRLDAGANGAAG